VYGEFNPDSDRSNITPNSHEVQREFYKFSHKRVIIQTKIRVITNDMSDYVNLLVRIVQIICYLPVNLIRL
jgi:hypothetical protein